MSSWFKRRIQSRDVVVVLLWGTAIAGLLAHDLFHGSFPSALDFGIFLGIGLISGMIISDFQRAIFGFIFAFAFGTTLVFVLAVLPALSGTVPPPGDQAVYTIWTVIIFRAVFPVPFIISLIAPIIGVGVGETYLEDGT